MAAPSRPVVGVVWAVLLLGLWLWGRDAAWGPGGGSAPTHGDIAAVGRPPGVDLPPSREPIPGAAEPRRVRIPALGIDAPVVPRGLDSTGAVDPPPYELPHAVGWYAPGTPPGAAGPALLVGHVDTETRPAVFYALSAARPGETVRVTRTDGSVAVFTIDDVRVVTRDAFDPRAVYGPRDPARAELRLITCGGTFDRATGTYTANVVVSAYLTAAEQPTAGGT
ncbi:class F sortase [Streptomyces sp. NPDC085466]|uniref:class F sortase n=1 Tax=Streptomyces sp. NPDC085466 TaxID=3365725 RepID=UPI0037D40C1C